MIENNIQEYKEFYKKYLVSARRPEAIAKNLMVLKKELESITTFLSSQSRRKWGEVEERIEVLLKNNFPISLYEIYDKEFSESATDVDLYNKDSPLILRLLDSMRESMNSIREMFSKEVKYKVQFLTILIDCLINVGLHPNINLREPGVYKRFNILVKHHFKSKIMTEEARILMNLNKFNLEFIEPYKNKLPLKIGGKLVPFKDIYEIQITTTLLKDDEIELFALKNIFEWNPINRIGEYNFARYCKDETDFYQPIVKNDLVVNSNHLALEDLNKTLKAYPKSRELYLKGIELWKQPGMERNALDNLRLALELLLKSILENNKPLEKQTPFIGRYYKLNGGNPEVLNMFDKLLGCYTKYQNNYIKHNDAINMSEVNFIFELSCSFMRLLIINK